MKTSQESVSRPPASKPHNVVTTKVLPRHRPEGPHTITESTQKEKQKPKTTALEKLVNKSVVKPRQVASTGPRSREEEEEDAYIAYLESKLGYTGGGSRRKDDDMDGLGGVLHCIFYPRISSHSPFTDLFDFTENIMTGTPVSLLCSYALCCI
jgi:nucleolar MIF4G domain-containing protein 1